MEVLTLARTLHATPPHFDADIKTDYVCAESLLFILQYLRHRRKMEYLAVCTVEDPLRAGRSEPLLRPHPHAQPDPIQHSIFPPKYEFPIIAYEYVVKNPSVLREQHFEVSAINYVCTY